MENIADFIHSYFVLFFFSSILLYSNSRADEQTKNKQRKKHSKNMRTMEKKASELLK